MSISFFHIF